MFNKRTILILILIACNSSVAVSQSQEKLYSLMLLSFAKGIHWPENDAKEFEIGIVEYPPLVPHLVETTAMTNIHGKKIKIIPISDLGQLKHCRIVFIPAYKSKLLSDVLQNIAGQPTLIVTNKTDLVKKGSGIDLVLRQGKLSFDMNCEAIQARGLKISAGLKSNGNLVQ